MDLELMFGAMRLKGLKRNMEKMQACSKELCTTEGYGSISGTFPSWSLFTWYLDGNL